MLGATFLAVCVLYAGSILAGWWLAKSGRVQFDDVVQTRYALTDPLTARFQRWHDRAKLDALRRKQWGRLWGLISANNLLAVAFVSRTLYGVTLVLPIYFSYRQGLGHGVLLGRRLPPSRGAFVPVVIGEFGAYLLATALGVNVTVTLLLGGAVENALRSILLFYSIVTATILTAAWLEVHVIRSLIPKDFELPGEVDMEALRAEALAAMKNQPDRIT